MIHRRELITSSLGAALLSAFDLARAQSSKTVRIVVPFAAGGVQDILARALSNELGTALGQTVIVENKAGAGGLIGTDYVSRQPADGYALLVSHASVHIYAAATRNVMPFDPVSDFSHLAMLVEAPMVILVRKDSPFQTLGQYIAAAKVKPVRYGTSGIGSANHLYGELLKIEGSAPQHDHVPYQGSAPAMQDLLSGQIDSLFDPITTNVAQLKSGSLRALAVSTPQRLPALPTIPTFAELGFSSMTGSQWLGLSAPKNLPAPIAQKLSALMPEILAKPDIMSRLEELQTLPRKTPVVGDEFVKLIQGQIDTWTKVAKRAKVEVVV